MLTLIEFEKIAHDIKRAAKVLSFVKNESDHEKRQLFLGLMVDEMDRLYADLEELKEKRV